MSETDYSRIRLGSTQVGILGMMQAFQEIARSYSGQSDEELGPTLLTRLRKQNYISKSAEVEYTNALVREFRKFMGHPCEEELSGALLVQVLGPGCSQCDRLEPVVMDALTELNLPASVEHVTDLKEIARHGVVGTPALLINGKVVSMGRVPPSDKVKEWLRKEASGIIS
jgi:small redox-active disulfide protein 2